MEKLAIALIVFVLLGSMSTPCDGLAVGKWYQHGNFGKRNYKDLNDGQNAVSRSIYRTFKKKYEATDHKAN